LISNRITWGDTPIVASPFPALDEIDQLIPIQRRLHRTANSIGGARASSGGSFMFLCMVMPHLKKPIPNLPVEPEKPLPTSDSLNERLRIERSGSAGTSNARHHTISRYF
jgi:hypothetical protein